MCTGKKEDNDDNGLARTQPPLDHSPLQPFFLGALGTEPRLNNNGRGDSYIGARAARLSANGPVRPRHEAR